MAHGPFFISFLFCLWVFVFFLGGGMAINYCFRFLQDFQESEFTKCLKQQISPNGVKKLVTMI